MSEASFAGLPLNIYEEALNEETICDCSSQGLDIAPKIENELLNVLYLQNNKLTTLPDDFFSSLPNLMYLDLRDNLLTDIPKQIQNHQTLTHLLLQNNKLTSLPYELGTVTTLKVLQLNGNPLMFPPRDIINAGISKVKNFLHDKFIENILLRSHSVLSEDTRSNFDENTSYSHDVVSYNSVIDEEKFTKNNLTIKVNEKESEDSDDEYDGRLRKKCPKLAKSRHKTLPTYLQSAKYLKPLCADTKNAQNEKIKQAYLKDLAIKKHKDLLATQDRILQDRKNIDLLRNWRRDYRSLKLTADRSYKLNHFPYDTSPEYMTLLTREDIEKDLPDKYKKKLVRKCRPSVPRRSNNDVHLALKIKQLFENLEAIDLNREGMTPRTEQKVLLNEIHKISEIKQKLKELSTTNILSVASDSKF